MEYFAVVANDPYENWLSNIKISMKDIQKCTVQNCMHITSTTKYIYEFRKN